MFGKNLASVSASVERRYQDIVGKLRLFEANCTSQRIVSAAIFFIFLAALTYLRYVTSYSMPRSSDDANNFLAGVEMGNGNWNLHGWLLAPDNLVTTDIVRAAILSRLLGSGMPMILFRAS